MKKLFLKTHSYCFLLAEGQNILEIFIETSHFHNDRYGRVKTWPSLCQFLFMCPILNWLIYQQQEILPEQVQ